MHKMSKKMEYALMALQLICNKTNRELTSAKEVAERMNIPFEVTARVLQALSSRGLLRAEYGVTGGYSLARSLNEISLYDLNEMLEGHGALTKCLDQDDSCEIASTCNISKSIAKLNKKVKSFYQSLTLDEVLHV